MRLSDFIAANTQLILAEWVEFAATCAPAARTLDQAELRDHAVEMLRIIVKDLRTPQTSAEQEDKSKGNAETAPGAADTAAEIHGALRAESGFSLGGMVSEYRALRASVIRLWTAASGELSGADLEDLTRFNEAIDQSVAESVIRYTQDIDYSKEMFIAVLDHDLRTPLGAVMMAAEMMEGSGELTPSNLALASRIARTSRRMSHMVSDLLDFTRSRLGSGIPIIPHDMDMAEVALHAVEEIAASQPDSVLQLHTSGELTGRWDSARISQVLSNLLSNSVQHGAARSPINVTVRGEPDEVVLRVHNSGPAIPAEEIAGLFSPIKRLKAGDATIHHTSHLGLGLYITERIVTAHGGSIDVNSSDDVGTSFTVRLPR